MQKERHPNVSQNYVTALESYSHVFIVSYLIIIKFQQSLYTNPILV